MRQSIRHDGSRERRAGGDIGGLEREGLAFGVGVGLVVLLVGGRLLNEHSGGDDAVGLVDPPGDELGGDLLAWLQDRLDQALAIECASGRRKLWPRPAAASLNL